MKEVLTVRRILDVLSAISSDRETAMYNGNSRLAIQKEYEFKRLIKPAFKLGYNALDINRANLTGKINACMEAGDYNKENFYRMCLKEID